MTKRTLALISLLIPFALAACEPEPTAIAPHYVLPARINLDVHTVSLIDHASSAPTGITATPFGYKPSISEAVRQWATDRLSVSGTSGDAIVTVKDASLDLQAIPTDNSIMSVFNRQQASKYVARVAVEVSARREGEFATANAEASRWVTMPENPTDAERQEAYFSLLNDLMRDLGQNLESNMRSHMQGFIVSGR